MMRFLVKYRAKIAWAILLIAIFVLTLTSSESLSAGGFLAEIPHFDKIVHFAMFFALAVVGSIVVSKSRYQSKMLYIANFVGVCFVGGLIELLQPYFGRTGSFSDFWADIAGAIVGALLARIIYINIIKKIFK